LSVGRLGQREEVTGAEEGDHQALEAIMARLPWAMVMASMLGRATPTTVTSLRILGASVATRRIVTERSMAGVTI